MHNRYMLLRDPWSVAVLLVATAQFIHAEDGIAWQVQGSWRPNQTQSLLRRGDPVAPGTLLTAGDSGDASILVLLPDGQRLLFDCHDAHTCNQGFRVPALITKPDDEAVEMFNRVRSAIQHPATGAANPPAATTTQTEAIVPLLEDGTIALKRALPGLPPGQYRLELLTDSDVQLPQRSLTWAGPRDESHLSLPHPGSYQLRLFGNLGRERMRVLLLATTAKQFPDEQKAFEEAKKNLEEWNETFPGWPTHEWLQLYLQSLAHPQSDER